MRYSLKYYSFPLSPFHALNFAQNRFFFKTSVFPVREARSRLSWRWLAISLLGLLLTFASTVSAQTPNPIRIMPLGASIVQGIDAVGEGGFRRPLYQMLIGAGYSVDFVGSQHNGTIEDFDHDHEGHSGWRAENIRDNITGWLNSTPADVILLHIGTNDISDNQGAASTAAEIGEILDYIDIWEGTHNPVWVVLARIISRNDSLSGTTTTLNGLIQNLADARIVAGDRIIVVDMESALIYPDDLYDIVHPNNTGYGKMAAAWFAVLEDLLISLPNPDITPDQFTFTNRTGVARNTAITSNIITVTGINAATPISVAGGTYSINGGPYTSADGTVINGNTVTVRQISSPSYYTMTNATLNIGGVSDTFRVTTQVAPSDSGGGDSGGGGGCFIATAAFGSFTEPHVLVLREFRGQVLSGNPLGRSFISFYYKVSPPIANFISQHETLRVLVRWSLLPVVGLSWMALNIGLTFTLGIMLILTVLLWKIVSINRSRLSK